MRERACNDGRKQEGGLKWLIDLRAMGSLDVRMITSSRASATTAKKAVKPDTFRAPASMKTPTIARKFKKHLRGER